MRHVDVFLIVWSQVCHTSLTTLLLPVGDRFLGSGTQQAPAQCVNSEFRSHGVVQIWRRRAQTSELGRDGKPESAPRTQWRIQAGSASLPRVFQSPSIAARIIRGFWPITRALCMALANHQSPWGEEVGLAEVPCPTWERRWLFYQPALNIVLTTIAHDINPLILTLQIRKQRFRERKKRLSLHSVLWLVFWLEAEPVTI